MGSAESITLGTSAAAHEASGGVGGRMGSAGPANEAQPWGPGPREGAGRGPIMAEGDGTGVASKNLDSVVVWRYRTQNCTSRSI